MVSKTIVVAAVYPAPLNTSDADVVAAGLSSERTPGEDDHWSAAFSGKHGSGTLASPSGCAQDENKVVKITEVPKHM